MADQLCFVQFPHPGSEHGPDAEDGTLKRWEIADAEVAASRTNEVFRLTTLDPMYEQETRGCRLYFAATTNAPVNDMFSFVPCLPADEGRTFARPKIELPRPLVNPNRAQQAGTVPFAEVEKLREVWYRVVAQVVEQGCALGVRVDLPTHRRRVAG